MHLHTDPVPILRRQLSKRIGTITALSMLFGTACAQSTTPVQVAEVPAAVSQPGSTASEPNTDILQQLDAMKHRIEELENQLRNQQATSASAEHLQAARDGLWLDIGSLA